MATNAKAGLSSRSIVVVVVAAAAAAAATLTMHNCDAIMSFSNAYIF